MREAAKFDKYLCSLSIDQRWRGHEKWRTKRHLATKMWIAWSNNAGQQAALRKRKNPGHKSADERKLVSSCIKSLLKTDILSLLISIISPGWLPFSSVHADQNGGPGDSVQLDRFMTKRKTLLYFTLGGFSGNLPCFSLLRRVRRQDPC